MFYLFGVDLPVAVWFSLAIVIVLVVIGAAAWAVRRLGSARVARGMRERLPRLAVSDYAKVDSRRQLVLVRRDNVEHLVMIGGPIDVVVEARIVRDVPAPRETTILRDPEPAESLARTVPLPEDGANGSWRVQPELPPSRPHAPGTGPEPEEHENIPLMYGKPGLRPQRSAGPLQVTAPPPLVPAPPPVNPIPRPTEPSAPLRPPSADVARNDRQERIVPRQHAAERSAVDESLAEMTRRLEAALRKPKSTELTATAPAPQQSNQSEAAAPTNPSAHDHLEQEMASLLGRASNKDA